MGILCRFSFVSCCCCCCFHFSCCVSFMFQQYRSIWSGCGATLLLLFFAKLRFEFVYTRFLILLTDFFFCCCCCCHFLQSSSCCVCALWRWDLATSTLFAYTASTLFILFIHAIFCQRAFNLTAHTIVVLDAYYVVLNNLWLNYW